MTGWRLALAIFLLIGSYWSYSIDLECQLQHCVSQHADEATSCSAPVKTVDPPLVVICPEHAPVLAIPLASSWPPPARPSLVDKPGWPPDPEFVREIGPPRAPPFSA